MEYAFVIAESGLIGLSHLPAQFQTASRELRPRPVTHGKPEATPNSDEKEALLEALRAAGGNKSVAAKILGVNRMTVWNRMRRYGLEVEKTVQDHNKNEVEDAPAFDGSHR
jgi:transcriptional regulator of acetoin/glycerol metabolism